METVSMVTLDSSDREDDKQLTSILMLFNIDLSNGRIQSSYKKLVKTECRTVKKASKCRVRNERSRGGWDYDPLKRLSAFAIPNRFFIESRCMPKYRPQQQQNSKEPPRHNDYNNQKNQKKNYSIYDPPAMQLRDPVNAGNSKRSRSFKSVKYTPAVEFNIPHKYQPPIVNSATPYQAYSRPFNSSVYPINVKSFSTPYSRDSIYNPNNYVGSSNTSSRQYHADNEPKYGHARTPAQDVESKLYFDYNTTPHPYKPQHQLQYLSNHQQHHQQHNQPVHRTNIYNEYKNCDNYSKNNPSHRRKQFFYDNSNYYNNEVADTTGFQYENTQRQTSGCVSNNYVPRDSFDYNECQALTQKRSLKTPLPYHRRNEYTETKYNGKQSTGKMKCVEFQNIGIKDNSHNFPNAYAGIMYGKESYETPKKPQNVYFTDNETPCRRRQEMYVENENDTARKQKTVKNSDSYEMLCRESDIFDIKEFIKQQKKDSETYIEKTSNYSSYSKAQNIPNYSLNNKGQPITEASPGFSLDTKFTVMSLGKDRSNGGLHTDQSVPLQQKVSQSSHKSQYSDYSSQINLDSPPSIQTFDEPRAKPRKRLKDRISGFFKKPKLLKSKSRIHGYSDRSCNRKLHSLRPKGAGGGYMHKIRKSASCLVVRNGRSSTKYLKGGGMSYPKRQIPYKCMKPISYPTVYRDKNIANEDDELHRSPSNFPKVYSNESQNSKSSLYVSQSARVHENHDTENISNCSHADNNATCKEVSKRSNINLVLSIHTNNCKISELPKIIDDSQAQTNSGTKNELKSSLRCSGKKVQKKVENLLKPTADDSAPEVPLRPIDELKQELLSQLHSNERYEEALKHQNTTRCGSWLP